MTAAVVGDPTYLPGFRPHEVFYNGQPDRQVVKCIDCGEWADARFGHHHGDCIDAVRYPPPMSALGVIRTHLLAHDEVDTAELRRQLDAAGIAAPTRDPAFRSAVRRGWVEVDSETEPGRVLCRSMLFGRPSTVARPR